MKVFAYLRVSGKAQIEGDGFDRQSASIAAFCERKGWSVVRTFKERGVSGTSDLDDRPAFSEMLELVGPGTANIIVVERADRLARDLIVNEMLVAEANKLGVKIYEAQSDSDLTCVDDPTRVLIRQILAVMAQWEKTVIVRRLKAARDRLSVARGKRIEGRPAWETLSPRNAEIAKEIFERHSIARERFKDIAASLTQRRIKTPEGKLFWQASTVCNIYDRFSRSLSATAPCERIRTVPNPAFSDVLGHVMPEPQV